MIGIEKRHGCFVALIHDKIRRMEGELKAILLNFSLSIDGPIDSVFDFSSEYIVPDEKETVDFDVYDQ
jgi:hypothetical protein